MKRLIHKELYTALAPIQRRMLLKSVVRMGFLGLIAVLGQSLIWVAVSFLFPIMYLEAKMAITGAGFLVGALILGLVLRPSIEELAKEVDSRGLYERVITAWELRERHDLYARLQRKDTLDKLKAFNPKSISISVPKNWVYTAVGLSLALLIGSLIPNPQEGVIRQRMQVQKTIDRQLDKMEAEFEDKLAREVQLTEEERKELMRLLSQLRKKLSESKDYKEAMKEVSKAEEKLAEIMKKIQEDKMASLGEELSKQEQTKSLGEKVGRMDAEGIRQEMAKLKKLAEMNEVDREIMKALQKALEEAAKSLPEGTIKEQMQQTADAIASDLANGSRQSVGELSKLESQLTQMAGQINKNPGDMLYMLQELKSKISQAAGQNNSQLALNQGEQSGNQDPSDSDSQGNQGSSGSGSQGNQSSSGSGNQGSQGNQGGDGGSNSSEGSSGSGNSNGSGNGDGSMGDNGGGQGGGIGTAHPEYERIYDPSRLGDGGNISQVKDNPDNNGSSQQVDAGKGLGSFEGLIPYNEVFGKYKGEALKNLDRMHIPPNMREWVKVYFSSLEE